MKITASTTLSKVPAQGPVRRAAENLLRDIQKLCLPGKEKGVEILLKPASLPAEQYRLRAEDQKIILSSGDELGFSYGLYRISSEILGVQAFWFWNDQSFEKREGYAVQEGWQAESTPCAVRFRGWFINDEVLLHAWHLHGSKDKPWEMAFEALLRLGGNMVIPGTGQNAHQYSRLASDYGLYVTHHHAEPLGAKMFLRAYPRLNPSYDEHPELFEQLWREGIEAQKSFRVLWNLGFRGQGDSPFWHSDPRYDTPEKRGALISSLIRKQYDLLRARLPQALCCTNLYGEIMALYRDGFMELPRDVIRIWADNGYGKMVSRRQGNHDPRVRALPDAREEGAAHGLYYHASFYDLQAANHMTMLPNPPAFVRRELREALALGVKDYWIVNCSNIKPHVFTLSYIAELWKNGDAEPQAHLRDYCERYYGVDNAQEISRAFEAFYDHALSYGAREDERAGEQFANHCARMLVSQWMKDADHPAEDMRWASDAPTLRLQIEGYLNRCELGVSNYTALVERYEEIRTRLTKPGKPLFEDSLMMQAKLLMDSYQGACHAMRALLYAMEKDWLQAFYQAGKSKDAYLKADQSLREREHGHWKSFYANECLTDVKQSAWLMGVLMGVLRNFGDGPHFYQWQRRFLDAPEDAGIMLILNMENHLDNDELFAQMKARME